MKHMLTSAVALAFATPAAAQTAPQPQSHKSQVQHSTHQHGAHTGHGQHADHRQHQSQTVANHGEHKGCCNDADADGTMDCCEAAQAGQRPCCAKHAQSPATSK